MKIRLSSAPLLVAAIVLAASAPPARATVDDSLSFALEAAADYVRAGFTVREDYWGGDLAKGESKTIPQQLFKGLEYWFWVGTDTEGSRVSVHVYDRDGKLADAETFQKKRFAGVRVVPKRTGTHYIVVTVESASAERTSWGLVYGYK